MKKRILATLVVALTLFMWGYMLPIALISTLDVLGWPRAGFGFNPYMEPGFESTLMGYAYLTPLAVIGYLSLDHPHKELLARLQVVPATIVYLFAAYHLYHYPDINTHFRNAIG